MRVASIETADVRRNACFTDEMRGALRAILKDPVRGGGKIVAHKAGVCRDTVYRLVRAGERHDEETVRKILAAYPELKSAVRQ